MKTARFALGLVAIALAAAAVARAESPKNENKLGPLERFVGGEWVIDGRWDSGEPLHARSVYEWGVNKKMIRARTYVKNGDSEYQRYETVFGWDPKRKRLFEISFAFNGEVGEHVIEPAENDTLKIGFTPFNADENPNVRQTLQFKDRDSFVWTVWVNRKGDWKRIMEGTWRRR